MRTHIENLQQSFETAKKAIYGTGSYTRKPFVGLFDSFATSTPMTEHKNWDDTQAKMDASRVLLNEARFYEIRSGSAIATIYCSGL